MAYLDIELTLSNRVTSTDSTDDAVAAVGRARLATTLIRPVVDISACRTDDEVAADGLSATHVIPGDAIPLGLLRELAVALERNGCEIERTRWTPVTTGLGEDLLWLAHRLRALNQELAPGMVVLLKCSQAGFPVRAGDELHASWDSDRRPLAAAQEAIAIP